MAQFTVRVQPGAKSDAIVGWVADSRGGEMLRVRFAPAVEGKANAGLVEFLAEVLGVRPRQIQIERGEKSREKQIVVEGLARADIKCRTEASA